jgi:hypothetical protein
MKIVAFVEIYNFVVQIFSFEVILTPKNDYYADLYINYLASR